jgi:hypothetical protein
LRDSHKRRGKRQFERQPFEITYGKFKRCLRRSILPRLQMKRKDTDEKENVEKQSEQKRINFQNVQLKET